MKKTLLFVLSALCINAYAGFIDVKSFKELHPQLASAYTAGVLDALDKQVICIPDGVVLGKVMDMLNHILSTKEVDPEMPADILIYRVFENVWKCGAKGKPV